MHVLILGFGLSGIAASNYCQKRGDTVFVYDDKLAANRVDLRDIELVVKSPGVPYAHPLVKEAQELNLPIIGEIDLALQELKGKTLYAVTGSNGKTTTTLLATHLLKTAGKKAIACGNVGTPLISQIDADADFFVVELSSFQLESIVQRPIFDKAILLNITPNHLDRHSTFEAYVESKFRLKSCLKNNAPFYISQAVAKQFHLSDPIFDIETICSLGYRDGRFYLHDLENIAAAYALTGVDKSVLKEGVATFDKPPHRIEFVRKHKGVSYINDSKATSVDAVIKAVEALNTPVILIAGGVDKGGAYSQWLPTFQNKVRKVVAIGQAAIRIAKELAPEIEVEIAPSFKEGVKKAAQIAKRGESVLLSPGCSSYDQFKNFEQRGERFKEIVFRI